jgi:hypothetical protein
MNSSDINLLLTEIDHFNQNEYIFWIEPGTSLFFKKALEIRESLIGKNWNISDFVNIDSMFANCTKLDQPIGKNWRKKIPAKSNVFYGCKKAQRNRTN